VTALTLTQWRAHEARIDAAQVRDGLPLLDLLDPATVDKLTSAEALALKHEPSAFLRPPQMVDDADPSWLTWVFMTGRGWGKSLACAAWLLGRILVRDAGDYVLIAPTIADVWDIQWRTLRELLPPWVRYVERVQRGQIYFPDHGILLKVHPAKVVEYRGANLRGAWCEEPIVWARGATLWDNLSRSLRVARPGQTPPRVVVATTPPTELTWLLDVCAEPTTRVVRGRMRDNPALPDARVDYEYRRKGAGSADVRRELDGEVVIGVEGALFNAEDLERYRVDAAPELDAVVIAVDPAQSARKTADTVGIVAVGLAGGHLYVLESASEQMTPEGWSSRAIAMADEHAAGRYVVEPTGAGEAPRALLNQAMQLTPGAPRLPIVESKARMSKADRAGPLAGACSRGRVHLVGRRHTALERELTTWHPGAGWSPGGMDALVHGAAVLAGKQWQGLA
jgi:phage terminase large subunit-like protein